MLDYVNRLINNLTLKNQGTSVHIGGFPTYTLAADLQRLWGTSKITKHMFSNMSSSGFTMHQFFLPDLVYMIDRVRTERNMRTSKRLLVRLKELILQETWMRTTVEKQESILDFSVLKKSFDVTPFDYQQLFLETYNTKVPAFQLMGYVLAAAPGLGKTLSLLMLAECLHADVVIPLALKNAMRSAWEKDMTEHSTDPAVKNAYWSDAMLPQQMTSDQKYFVLHYEAIGQMVQIAKLKKGAKRIVIGLDESHNFNDSKSQRSQLIVEMIRMLRKQGFDVQVCFMSGTPIKQMGGEMIPCLQCIDPMFDAEAEKRFKAIYGITASRANDILAARIGNLMHIVPKESRRPEKPTVESVPVKIPNGKDYTLASIKDEMAVYVRERMKFYQDHRKEFQADYDEGLATYQASIRTKQEEQEFKRYKDYVAVIRKRYDPVAHKDMALYCNNFETKRIIPMLSKELKARFKEAKSVVKYVNLKIQGEALANVLGVARINCNVDMLKAIDFAKYIDEAEKKTLIFTSYVPVVETLTEQLVGLGYKPEPIYGRTNKDINAILKRLKEDPDANPPVATYDSLAEAVPMLMCNTLLLLNSPWRSSDEIQAISRCDRVGQDAPVMVFRFHLDTGSEPNVSTRSKEIMELSRAMVADLLGIDDSTAGSTAAGVALAMEGFTYDDEYVALTKSMQVDVPVTRNSFDAW